MTPTDPNQPGTARLPSVHFWRRFMGQMYEVFLLLAVILAFFFIFSILTHWTNSDDPQHRLLSQVSLFLTLGAYFVWCWSGARATLPMQTLDMMLVDQQGKPLTFLRAAWRYLLAWPSLGFFGLGFWWAFFDHDRQSLHDRLAGTRLVLAPDRRATKRSV